MRKVIDLTGERFGRLLVLKSAEPCIKENGRKKYMWLCLCECGKTITTSTASLRSGHTKSCGCLQKEIASKNKIVDISGQKFGMLTAIKPIKRANKNPRTETIWLCKCECGNFTNVTVTNLKSGHTKSCGCLKKNAKNPKTKRSVERKRSAKRERSIERKKRVGKYEYLGEKWKRLYRIWSGMKTRCFNPKSSNFKYYGGRGITVCEEWVNDNGFINFYKWAIENGYSENLTIDRKNNDKGYFPSNCRWITMKEQARNTRQSKSMEYRGEKKTFSEWSEITGIKKETLKQRFYDGWSAEKCIETPVRNRTLKKE